MGQTDIQFKDDLRKELIIYEKWLKLLDNKNTEEVKQELQAQIDRIKASLQD